MSRTERERVQIANERWPNLRDFIAAEFADDFFKKFEIINRLMLDKVQELSVDRMKVLATECFDFVEYFSGRIDDVYMLLDGMGAKVPVGKIQYEDARPKGVVRVRALYSELARLIRQTDLDWKP